MRSNEEIITILTELKNKKRAFFKSIGQKNWYR